jgi:hypothetical protein
VEDSIKILTRRVGHLFSLVDFECAGIEARFKRSAASYASSSSMA